MPAQTLEQSLRETNNAYLRDHHRHDRRHLPGLRAALSLCRPEAEAGQAAQIGASAIGSFLGSIIGGFLADSVGFNAINWMAAISAGLGALVLFFIVWPAERKKQKIESQATPING